MQIKVGLTFFILTCLATFVIAKPPIGYTTKCKIVRVLDGDTIEVSITRTLHVRLLDCWAPETRTLNPIEKLKGKESKAHLLSIAKPDTPATLFIPMTDDLTDATTLGRVLGHVWVEGNEQSLSEIQVAAGFAAKSKGGPVLSKP